MQQTEPTLATYAVYTSCKEPNSINAFRGTLYSRYAMLPRLRDKNVYTPSKINFLYALYTCVRTTYFEGSPDTVRDHNTLPLMAAQQSTTVLYIAQPDTRTALLPFSALIYVRPNAYKNLGSTSDRRCSSRLSARRCKSLVPRPCWTSASDRLRSRDDACPTTTASGRPYTLRDERPAENVCHRDGAVVFDGTHVTTHDKNDRHYK